MLLLFAKNEPTVQPQLSNFQPRTDVSIAVQFLFLAAKKVISRLIAVTLLVFGFVFARADVCGDLILGYSRNMTTCVCHQAAAVVFANFEGVREKTVALSENSVPIDTFKDAVFAQGASTAWMATYCHGSMLTMLHHSQHTVL